jgi:tripartite-type tricarboxylate transporter receptor subunit TctC
LPGQEAETILLALAPAGTPKPIVDMLQREIVKALKAPDVVQKLNAFGFSPLGTTPDEADARIKAELAMWTKVIKDAKIQQ